MPVAIDRLAGLFLLFPLVNAWASEQRPTHPVHRLAQVELAGDVFPPASAWQPVPVARLRHSMGKTVRPLPQVTFQIAYDEEALYLRYDVLEYAVRAVAKRHGDSVSRDSCVEFFFSPSADLSAGYFNLEMNCGGIALLHYHPAKRTGGALDPAWLADSGSYYRIDGGKRVHKTTAREFRGADIRTSLPKRVEPELKGPLRWTLEARIPFSLLQKINPFPTPKPGAVWCGNFYKCGDETSRPHWLAWAKVDYPSPAFHVPKSFGRLVFQ